MDDGGCHRRRLFFRSIAGRIVQCTGLEKLTLYQRAWHRGTPHNLFRHVRVIFSLRRSGDALVKRDSTE
jgi:hypothetical protein